MSGGDKPTSDDADLIAKQIASESVDQPRGTSQPMGASSTVSGYDYVQIAAAGGVVKNRSGFLGTVTVVTAISAGAITIYDNPSAASGTILYQSAATPAAGFTQQLGIRAKFGIFVAAFTGGPINVTFE